MITEIAFRNFKCLDGKKPFRLSKVNVFSGYNGRGKSSVMQFLLMLSQSVRKDQNHIRKLHLNGEYVNLGDFYEIQTNDKNNDVTIEFKTDDAQINTVKLSYQLSDEDFKIGLVDECLINGVDFFDVPVGMGGVAEGGGRRKDLMKPVPTALTSLFQNIYYVSANRQGPVKYEERQEVPEFVNVGAFGDRTINTLVSFKGSVSDIMITPDGITGSYRLLEMASQWVNYIMRGGSVGLAGGNDHKHPGTVLSLDFSFKSFNRSFNSYNVGFGYSYILSIVVTALIARKGSIVIIENPEAHLHPEAQLRLTQLLARVAGNGVQVFIETHSEHILNGFRLAALKGEGALSYKDLSLYFFGEDFSIDELKLQADGRIPNWPYGFFDQFEREMAEIIELGSKVR